LKTAITPNLEQVSDWLTKIILGAGLTQLVRLPYQLGRLGEYFKPEFENSSVLPVLIVLSSFIFGFFAGYVLTQLFLATALKAAADARNKIVLALTTEGAGTATLVAGVKAIRSDTPKEIKRALYERLIYNSLYDDPPGGFSKAIEYAEQYIREEPENASARIWAYLAAALGQKYKWETIKGNRQEILAETRNRALEACRRAIQLEPQLKSLLRMLWDPNDPTKFQSEEDDLEPFYNDSDFCALFEGS